MPRVLTLDIGGANLKAAHSDGSVRVRPFEVWRQPARLGDLIEALVREMPAFDMLAVTMTAELCDCFETKAAGVGRVLDEVARAIRLAGWAGPVGVWMSYGRIVSLEQARAEPHKAAASNWLALATWAGRLCPDGPALVIDVGSTTTDIVPLRDGVPVPRGRTDFDRLAAGELVYSGARRTPICAVLPAVELGGRRVPVAAELFATTLDAHVWLGEMSEDSNDCGTADGRTATREFAAARLARVVCADRTMLADDAIDAIARQVTAAQLATLVAARRQVEAALGEPPCTIVIAGSGEFLARRIAVADGAHPQVVSLADTIGAAASAAACAYALTVLAAERSIDSISDGRLPTPDSRFPAPRTVVLKVGGSLFDLPDLGERLTRFIDRLETPRVILVAGGGASADKVRRRDQLERLAAERAHWLAIRAMTFNSHLIEAIVPRSRVLSTLEQCRAAWHSGEWPILDPEPFLVEDGARAKPPLPESWEVTSDSIAARVARVAGADELVLLKSVDWPASASLDDAAARGVVDEYLPIEARRQPSLVVRIANFRAGTTRSVVPH